MTSRLNESERRHKYSYYASHSPLKSNRFPLPSLKELNQEEMKGKLSRYEEQKKKRELNFILDGVHEQVHKSNVVPSYNAFLDPHAQSYFRQPAIQVMLKRAAEKDGHLIPPAIPTHKLSTRRRIPNTPGKLDTVRRENKFTIDSVRTDSLKSRRNPVIPEYDALNDLHAQSYFKKKSVRHLLQRTCNISM